MTGCARNLSPELQARVTVADIAIPVVLEAAAKIRHDQSDAQIHALALHGTITELFSARVVLTRSGEPNAIPILFHGPPPGRC
jgi:hypothetical protein